MLSERRLGLDRGIAASRPVRVVLVIALVVALILSWGVFLARTVWPAAHDNFWRQPGTWVGARLAVEGHAEYLYADGKLFARESTRLGANPDIFSVNFPTAIIPFLPLTSFDVNTARTLWKASACYASLRRGCFCWSPCACRWRSRLPSPCSCLSSSPGGVIS